jgi:DNA mismatch repair protein MutL
MANHVRLLPPEEARKIAAGEVVDRPAALVREFIDNAIDAGATLIEVNIEGGGGQRIEVIDDGVGMAKEDLELCWKTHATSKIRSMDDLAVSNTLGFRGEALAAAAAVSHLEILSSADGREAWRLEVGPAGEVIGAAGGAAGGAKSGAKGKDAVDDARIKPARRKQGTSTRAIGLFDTIPARKRFLKRDSSEAAFCRQTFVDKALAFPDVGFRFTVDKKLKTMVPVAQNLKERFAALLLSRDEAAYLHEIHAVGEGFSISVVVGGPELSCIDRRRQYIFANGRRIQEFSFQQALEYGTQGWFPNGTHPICAVYLNIDPALADFNIHPAKREARFADAGAIHHAISSALRDFVHHGYLSAAYDTPTQNIEANDYLPLLPRQSTAFGAASSAAHSAAFGAAHSAASAALALEALLEKRPAFAPLPGRSGAVSGAAPSANPPPLEKESAPGDYRLRYAGKVFDIFIMVEKEDQLFMIDQHAAHERLLYEQFLAKPIPTQELLVTIPFQTPSEEDDRFLATRQEALGKLGVVIKADNGAWRIEALPASWHLGDAETVQAILGLRQAGEDFAERWLATLACHSAVKEGDFLDERAALALAEAALALPEARCPHGRPIFFELSRAALLHAVKRL